MNKLKRIALNIIAEQLTEQEIGTTLTTLRLTLTCGLRYWGVWLMILCVMGVCVCVQAT